MFIYYMHFMSSNLLSNQNEEPIILIQNFFSITSSPQCFPSYFAHSDLSINELESPLHPDCIPLADDVRHL